MDEKSLIQRNFNKMSSQTMVFAKQKAYRKAEITSFKDSKFKDCSVEFVFPVFTAFRDTSYKGCSRAPLDRASPATPLNVKPQCVASQLHNEITCHETEYQ